MVHCTIDSVAPAEYSKPVEPKVESYVITYNGGDITFYLRREDLASGNVQVSVVENAVNEQVT